MDKIFSFNSSLSFDKRMFREDIQCSIVHAQMLGATGIIPQDDSEKIIAELEKIRDDIESGKLQIENAEDIHMFIEAELTRRIGEAGKRLHTARSRNDQIATDLRVYLKREKLELQNLLIRLITMLGELMEKHDDTIMPGYTHLQRAQPITFKMHLEAYIKMFQRDKERLDDAAERMMRECPLGSGALAGTTHPIDRMMTAKELGFYNPQYANTLDGVSDRDFCIEITSALSLIMVHLSRFSEEIILWCSWEFKFIKLDEKFTTGSSIMPQKRNPDIAELVRGKAGRVFGNLQSLLVIMKGLPLAYNKDMQEIQEAVFDAVDTVKKCLEAFIPMLETMNVNKENMREACAKGFLNATDCADYLVSKGMAFREAHKITSELVTFCMKNNIDLEGLKINDYKRFSELFTEDIYEFIKLENCILKRKRI